VNQATEQREYATTLRDVEVTGKNPYQYLEGQAVPYNVWQDVGPFLERHALDSFKRSTTGGSGKAAPLLLFHDRARMPIGHAYRWTHDGGLHGVWKLNDSPDAMRAAEMARSGDLVGLSVGFMDAEAPDWEFIGWDDWAPELGPEHKDKVTRRQSRLVEVSMTPTPAYGDAAAVTSVRSAYGVEVREAAVPHPVLAVDAWRAELEQLRSAP
jgi:HK97 family phage prohead protease